MQQIFGSVTRIAVVALWSSGAALAQEGVLIAPQDLPAIVPTDTVEISISNLMGTPVVDATGADLGQIADVIVDGETGRVARLVISKGGIAGFFDSKVAVDAGSVRLIPVDGRIVATGLTPDEVQRYSGAAGQD